MHKKAANDGSINFSGRRGKRRLFEALKSQTLVSGSAELAKEIIKCGVLQQYKAADVLMQQGDPENDVYLVVTGEVSILANGRVVASRAAGTHVGEMALIDPLAKRSATVVAAEPTISLKLSEHHFSQIAARHPELWRRVAVEIAKRLRERNRLLRQPHNESVLFIGSSTEGEPIAEEVYKRLVNKRVVPKLWSDGVFEASSTSIESLVKVAQEADFAALILTADDITKSRGAAKPSPRDNVIFELGLFIGAIGRHRVFILKPKGIDIRIPSDLLGVVWLEYLRSGPKKNRIAPTCKKMWNSIDNLGPK
jgi:CRP/FNR family cyclic AMP-dependent transcriptional regulator